MTEMKMISSPTEFEEMPHQINMNPETLAVVEQICTICGEVSFFLIFFIIFTIQNFFYIANCLYVKCTIRVRELGFLDLSTYILAM